MEKIKILHVIGIMDYGGAETMIMNIYRKIDKNKFQFDFLVHRDRRGAFDEEIVSYGGRIFRVPEYKVYNYISYKKACEEFFHCHSDYDIVHGHIESCASIYLNEAKKVGIFTIAHSHSAGFQSIVPRILYNYLTHNTRRVADRFFACSIQAGVNRFGKKIVDSERFQVFNNGIETQNYIFSNVKQRKLKREWGVEGKTVIGHVGRMSKEKNQKFLIELFCELCTITDKEFVLVLIGDGYERANLESVVEKKGVKDKVIFTGIRKDIPELMNMFDIFVFPSIYEGLPIALVEAQAAGLPCVVSDAITDQAILVSNVKKVSLKESKHIWITTIFNLLKDERKNNYEAIKSAGFDVNETTKKLENMYEKYSKKG